MNLNEWWMNLNEWINSWAEANNQSVISNKAALIQLIQPAGFKQMNLNWIAVIQLKWIWFELDWINECCLFVSTKLICLLLQR